MNEPLPANNVMTILEKYWGIDSLKYGITTREYGDASYPYGQYTIPPAPIFLVVNDPEDTDLAQRFDYNIGDLVLLRAGMAGYTEEYLGYNLSYKRVRAPVRMEIGTKSSRQRLYNLLREIRRVCYTNRIRLYWILEIGVITGTFHINEKITGGISGITANIDYIGSGYLIISNHSGYFLQSEVITGQVSSAFCTVSGEQMSYWHLLRWRSFNESTEQEFNVWYGTAEVILEADGIDLIEGYSGQTGYN